MKEVILIVLLSTSATSGSGIRTIEKQYAMPDMATCVQVLKQTKVETPNQADDNEWIGLATCGYR